MGTVTPQFSDDGSTWSPSPTTCSPSFSSDRFSNLKVTFERILPRNDQKVDDLALKLSSEVKVSVAENKVSWRPDPEVLTSDLAGTW